MSKADIINTTLQIKVTLAILTVIIAIRLFSSEIHLTILNIKATPALLLLLSFGIFLIKCKETCVDTELAFRLQPLCLHHTVAYLGFFCEYILVKFYTSFVSLLPDNKRSSRLASGCHLITAEIIRFLGIVSSHISLSHIYTC